MKSSNFSLFILCDIVCLIVAFLCALYIAPHVSQFLQAGNVAAPEFDAQTVIDRVYFSSIVSVILLFLLYNKGHYTVRVPWWEQVFYIMGMAIFALLIDGFFHFAIKEQLSRILIVTLWVFVLFFILMGRQIARKLAIARGSWNVDAVVIGNADNAIDTFFALSSDSYCGYQVKTLLLRDKDFDDFDREWLPLQFRDIKILDGRKDYVDYVIRNSNKFYITALDAFRGDERDNMMNVMQENGVDNVIVPPTGRVSLYGMEPQFFFGHDVMFLRRRDKIRTPLGRVIKRAMDIILSSIALLIFCPLFLVISVLIRCDGGKAFYADTRVGRYGKLFKCWKFRSMYSDADVRLKKLLASDKDVKKEYDRYCKLKNDPRITKVGGFLRKTSIDELPQLINVLKGEMSIVGPRPMLENEIRKYGEDYPSYKEVRPGITGLWQVSGRSDTSFMQRVVFDCWYVRNWSVWHDIVIIIKTIKVVIFRSGAY